VCGVLSYPMPKIPALRDVFLLIFLFVIPFT
jgi:hypothetical protein